METPKTIREKIRIAATTEDAEVRARYLSAFEAEIDQFVEGMSKAFERWQQLDENSSEEPRRAYASALVYSALTLHITSMNLFLSGQLVAAGNIQRQVLESIALAFLISARNLNVFEQYANGKFSSNKAPTRLLKHHGSLGLNKEAVKILNRATGFYHNWSHANLMTLATHMEGDSKNIYVGAAFDESKREQYLKEAKGRANLASIFENFVIGVQSIVSGGTNFDEGHLSKSQAQIPLNEIPKAREVTNQWGHDIKLRVLTGVISGIVGLLIGLLISS